MILPDFTHFKRKVFGILFFGLFGQEEMGPKKRGLIKPETRFRNETGFLKVNRIGVLAPEG